MKNYHVTKMNNIERAFVKQIYGVELRWNTEISNWVVFIPLHSVGILKQININFLP
jgi:hypothetical protein